MNINKAIVYGLTAFQLVGTAPLFSASRFKVKTDQLQQESTEWDRVKAVLADARDIVANGKGDRNSLLKSAVVIVEERMRVGSSDFADLVKAGKITDADQIAQYNMLTDALLGLNAIRNGKSTESALDVLNGAIASADAIVNKEVTDKENANKEAKEQAEKEAKEKAEKEAKEKNAYTFIVSDATEAGQLAAISELGARLGNANKENFGQIIANFHMLLSAGDLASEPAVKAYSEFFFTLREKANSFGFEKVVIKNADGTETVVTMDSLKGMLDAQLGKQLDALKQKTPEQKDNIEKQPVNEQPTIDEKKETNSEDLNAKKNEEEQPVDKKIENTETTHKAPEQNETKSDGSETLKVRKTKTSENKESNEAPEEKKEQPSNNEDLKVQNNGQDKQAPMNEEKTGPLNENSNNGSERLEVKKQNAPVDEATALKNVNTELAGIETGINSLTSNTSADDITAIQERVENLSKSGKQVFEKYSDLNQKFLELELKLSVTLTDIESERSK